MAHLGTKIRQDASAAEYALAAHALDVNRAQRARDIGNNAAARHYARNARLLLACYRHAKEQTAMTAARLARAS